MLAQLFTVHGGCYGRLSYNSFVMCATVGTNQIGYITVIALVNMDLPWIYGDKPNLSSFCGFGLNQFAAIYIPGPVL